MSRVLSLFSNIPDLVQFTPVRLSGAEGLNQLYEYTLILKTPDESNFNPAVAADIDLTSWLYQNVTIGIELDGKSVQKDQLNQHHIRDYWHEVVGKGTRHINGLIETAQFLYNQGRSSYYQITIRPWLQQAILCSDYKIHQNLNVLDLLRAHLDGYNHPVEYRLSTPESQYPIRFPKRDYQCQFNESDFTFFARICSEWGLNWWFEHEENSHKLIIADGPQAHKVNPSEAYHQVYYYPPNYKIAEEYIHELNIRAKTVSGSFALNDYDYTQPNANLLYQNQRATVYPEAQTKNDAKIAKAEHQIYNYAADTVQPKAGPMQESNEVLHENPFRAAWNLERLQQEHFQAEAKGYIRGLTVGHTFELKGHPSKIANINWRINRSELLIIDLAEESQRAADQNNTVSTQNTSGSLLEGLGAAMLDSVTAKLSQLGGQFTGTAQQWHIESHLLLLPASVMSRPELIEKPRSALQTAIVVGEELDSIYTDALGRIKVQFHWDRYGAHNTNSSCWVRVNQPWAGNQMGATFIPRVGQEVLIDFINADPDLPICIGKVHNQSNQPSWQLTHNQALSGFRSRELGESQAGNNASGRSNHLVFDDSEEHIQTQLKSDHAHSQLSMGDITRIDGNRGRKEARGQGFELRTDDWGSIRTSKGLYLSTFDRSAATGAVMDAIEPADLFKRSQEINATLAKVAKKLEAEPVSSGKELKTFAKSLEIPKDAEIPTGFENPDMILASSENIGVTADQHIYTYSDQNTNVTAGKNIEVLAGNSWLASIANKLSFVVQRGIQIFSSSGKVQIHANDNDIDIIAERVLRLMSASGKVKIHAAQEIELEAGGSTLRISAAGIINTTGANFQAFAASHDLVGPQTGGQSVSLPKGEDSLFSRFQLTSLPEGGGFVFANEAYILYKDGAELTRGVTDNRGNLVFKHEEGAKYVIETANGKEFEVKQEGKAGSELQKAQGYRGSTHAGSGTSDTKFMQADYDARHKETEDA